MCARRDESSKFVILKSIRHNNCTLSLVSPCTKTLKKQGGILSFVRVISIIMMHRRLTLICARVRIEIHIGLASWGQSAAGAAYLPCTSKMEGARHWRYDRIVYPAVSVSVSVLQRAHRISQSVVHMLPKKQKHVLSPS